MSNEMTVVTAKNLVDKVGNQIAEFVNEGSLVLPPNYSPENAVKSAYLVLEETVDKNQNPVLKVCSATSIYQAVLNMAILGLNPIKKQCYFVPYGKKLTMMESYFGKQTILNRVEGIEGLPVARVVYEGDEITYDIDSMGRIHNIQHKQEFKNIDEDKIIGAYCVIKFKGLEYGTVRTYKQIQESWKGAKQKGGLHKHFREEFAKKTVINVATKNFIQTSSDQDLFTETYIQNQEEQYDLNNLDKVEEVKDEVDINANKQSISVGSDSIQGTTDPNIKATQTVHDKETGEVFDIPEDEVIVDTEESDDNKGTIFDVED